MERYGTRHLHHCTCLVVLPLQKGMPAAAPAALRGSDARPLPLPNGGRRGASGAASRLGRDPLPGRAAAPRAVPGAGTGPETMPPGGSAPGPAPPLVTGTRTPPARLRSRSRGWRPCGRLRVRIRHRSGHCLRIAGQSPRRNSRACRARHW